MNKLSAQDIERRLAEAIANRTSVPPKKLISDLLATFNLSATGGEDEFIFPARKTTVRERIFGGQVIAQAMIAANLTVEDVKHIHSLHSYFLRAGSEPKDLHFKVHRDFDGRTISNRRVVVRQDGKVIFNLTASFQKPLEGLHHQVAMPEVLPPEDCRGGEKYLEYVARNPSIPDGKIKRMTMPRPFEICHSRPQRDEQSTRQYQWFKAIAPLPDDPLIHRATLAFASDMGLLSTSMLPHGLNWTTPGLFSTSLDHAMWFHDHFRLDQWVCYIMDSDWTGGGRGHNRGSFFTSDGKLIASAVQEGMLRIS
ncbi:MAG: acyl-CoA thioesterase II [Parasphingorhabdus sp.]|uniref:acyl-CoA thioesterase n=1 Tax=Parasphingorhabdus sp. TaxID=2709688 RepID=UPI0032968875